MKTLHLRDFKVAQERWAFRQRERRLLPQAFGEFIGSLANWDWFINPLTFRDDSRTGGPPVRDVALARIYEYLSLLQKAASGPIGWVIAEEFGSIGGRWHCHILIAGVRNLPRKFWWAEAHRRFGWTRLEPFDPTRGAAFYAAKYAAKALGNIHFGGILGDHRLSLLAPSSEGVEVFALSEGSSESKRVTETQVEIAASAELPQAFYRLSMPRWHRNS